MRAPAVPGGSRRGLASVPRAQPAPGGRPARWRHPLLAAALAAVAVAAAGVGGAGAWRHHTETRRAQLAELRTLAGSAGDAQALAALRAAAARGETAAQTALGEALWDRAEAQPLAEGRQWLQKAALGGDVRAHLLLGKAALLGVPAGSGMDPARARAHLGAAADAGDPGAAYYLGLLHRGGYGQPANPKAAAHWFTLAAQGGVPHAMFMLANAYREGDGVPLDPARALAWYEQAAEREHPESSQALAMAYRNGELGLARDERRFRSHLAEAAHALRHPALAP
ncbi:tetratricopeptide repeat protein [Cupriavidus sp. USMAA2-4]|uniref:tetratricopeptide repeat protein n=1 Tax=Cupriavidus sp. USMAA2-4 TaxID=876364 RepID=UPI000A055322|nr:tetratricopeptide repeat protein [Cupriavidus sp. USMAA2-4]